MLARLLAWLVPARRSPPTPEISAAGSPMPPGWTPQSRTRLDGPTSNEWTGAGTIRDKLEATLPSAPTALQDEHLDWLCASPLGRVIRHPPEQAMARGYRVDVEGDRAVTADVDEVLGLRDVLRDWLIVGRGGRGSHILIVDGSEDWGEPIRMGIGVGPGGIQRLHVLDHRDAIPVAWDSDPSSPTWMEPIQWQVVVRRNGRAQVIGRAHATRLVTHHGLRSLPGAQMPGQIGYGYSMWHAYWPAVRRLWTTSATGEVAGIELTSPWIRLGSLATFVGDVASAARSAISTLTRARSSHGTTVLMPGDEIGRETLSLSGYSDLTAGAWSDVAAVEGYPLTRLVGQAPAGLTSDDESGHQTWAMLLDTMSATMERAGRQIHDVVLGPGRRTWVWGAVRVPSDLEVAQADLVRSQRDEALVRIGAAAPAHVAARYQGPEVLPEPVIPAEWRGVPPQGVEGVTAAYVGAHEAGLISRETAALGLAAVGVARASDAIAAPGGVDVDVDTDGLNGAQITAVLDVLAQQASGAITADAASILIQSVGVTLQQASMLVAGTLAPPSPITAADG